MGLSEKSLPKQKVDIMSALKGLEHKPTLEEFLASDKQKKVVGSTVRNPDQPTTL